jgi:hypothetical protein
MAETEWCREEERLSSDPISARAVSLNDRVNYRWLIVRPSLIFVLGFARRVGEADPA